MSKIYDATICGDVNAWKKIIKTNPQALKYTTRERLKPLHLATKLGHYELVQWFLAQGICVNDDDNYLKSTPLDLAIEYKHNKIVKLLLEKSATSFKKDILKKAIEFIHLNDFIEKFAKHLINQ